MKVFFKNQTETSMKWLLTHGNTLLRKDLRGDSSQLIESSCQFLQGLPQLQRAILFEATYFLQQPLSGDWASWECTGHFRDTLLSNTYSIAHWYIGQIIIVWFLPLPVILPLSSFHKCWSLISIFYLKLCLSAQRIQPALIGTNCSLRK